MFFNIYGSFLILKSERANDFFKLTFATGLLFFIAALFYPKKSEDNRDEHSMNTIKGFSDKKTLIKQFLNVKEIRNSLLFFVIVSVILPNYEEFLFSYNDD